MRTIAEYRCIHCGALVARVLSDPAQPDAPVQVEPVEAAYLGRKGRQRLRCGRCGGPVLLDEQPLSTTEKLAEDLLHRPSGDTEGTDGD